MADTTETQRHATSGGKAAAIEGGAYDIIRARLTEQGRALGDKANSLNEQRVQVFGGTEMKVLVQERIRTENNCIARDIVPLGEVLLFGYNVFLGLKRETKIDDVFGVYKIIEDDDGFGFEQVPLAEVAFLSNGQFVRDFDELYKYYKDAKLVQLRRVRGKLLAVFQIGDRLDDVKVLRWGIENDGQPRYIDNRGDDDNIFPPAHDFEWTRTTRDNYVLGKHPHVNIDDTVFVETVGGDLTVKVEDNTDDGQGIYRELVDDKDQSLDDAEIHYARLGTLYVIKVLPYREETWRYLVFNSRNQDVKRIDAIGKSCVQLPEDHGLIFPGGYYLQDGETKSFDVDPEGLEFKRAIRSPNGEDVMYVFYQRAEGRHVLLSYNLIRKEVAAPILCNGFSIFDDGSMVVFREESEPKRVHGMTVWQTAFMSELEAERRSAASEHAGSMLVKIGNAELVRGISDCSGLRRAIGNQSPTMQIYEDLVAHVSRVIDNYHWLAEPEVGDLASTLKEILKNAELIIDEFEKVLSIQKAARESLAQAKEEQGQLIDEIRPDLWQTVDHFVDAMARLRRQRGRLITLREMRYMDTGQVDALETEVREHFEELSGQAVEFLLRDDALKPYRDKDADLMQRIEDMQQAREAEGITEDLDVMATGLDLLTEVVGGLQIDDPTARTRILEEISEIFALVNRARATLEGRRTDLASEEGVAEFGAQFKLFNQSVQSALAVANTPEKCDEQLSRLMVQLEELEGRFGEFDQFLGDLATKRDEVYEALNGKKQTLLEAQQRRAQNLASAAERIMQGVSRRALGFKELEDLNAYFAADTMVLKLRDISEQLMELGDTVRADEVISKIKATRDTAARQLRDKNDLFADGDNIIKLGKHRFTVNTQTLDLTMLPRDDRMVLHLSGTDFFERVDDPAIDAARPYWDQALVSETDQVYRGEYLAACMLADADAEQRGLSFEVLREALANDEGLLALVRRYAADRYDEGYDRGVHDHDAALILEKLLGLYRTAGLLRFAPRARALACLYWTFLDDAERRALIARKAQSLGRLRDVFAQSPAHQSFAAGLCEELTQFFAWHKIEVHAQDLQTAGRYLAEELAAPSPRFTASAEANRLRELFERHLDGLGRRADFDEDQRQLGRDLLNRYGLARAWIEAFVTNATSDELRDLEPVIDEAVALLLTEGSLDRDVSGAMSRVEVQRLLGQHKRIEKGTLRLRLDEFLSRLTQFRQERVPAFHAFRALRQRVADKARQDLRLDEFKPRVLSSFVRNRLINDVYLPLVGDNLAKQLGAAGDRKRTDLMGLLLLISPPGYGKTTLMEYVANRVGLIFMKINGPSLGHGVTSFDPSEAPNATARQEVNKINLAFEMGNNVMLYVDDIQHTNPEFLQKFISLCDASRRVEGVWKGRTRTYDLRGKKFCVVMAGNPYTESGDKFQIPDMLTNRADIYNLGDILGGKEDIFALSYIENALTSNTVLQPLATRELSDLYLLVRMAKGEEIPASELKHDYSGVELQELMGVLQRMFRAQDVVLQVNQAYIASAATDDKFRTEPRFQLQGSYRNMNKMAEKIVSIMNDSELEQLIDDHYQGEAQTLTSGAEANLLKLAELRGTLDEQQAERWDEIKKSFARNQMVGGDDDDPVTRVTATLGGIGQQLGSLQESIVEVAGRSEQVQAQQGAQQAQLLARELAGLRQALGGAAEQMVQQAGAGNDARAAQIRDELAALRNGLAEAAKVLARFAVEKGGASVQQLSQELGQLRQGVLWAAQSSAQQTQQSRQRELQQTQKVMQSLDAIRQALAQSTQASLRVQGSMASNMQQQTQTLAQGIAQMARATAEAQPFASQAPQGPDPLVQILAQQSMLLEGTLIPMVKALSVGVRADRGTTQRLDQALVMLKQLEELAKKGGLRGGGRYYGAIGTRVK